MILASDFDCFIGMNYYATDSPGCGGVLRQRVEDFSVEEIWEDRGYRGGRYLVVEVEKENWDTHHLVRDLSRRLGISQRRFGWAGTKDKRAITRQRMSIINLDEKKLDKINLPRVKVEVLGKTNRSISLGDLKGNNFQVRIRGMDLSKEEVTRRLETVTSEVQKLGGLPNYFGVQRFGDVRPVTHLVGKALAKGNPKKAVLTYLALPYPREPEVTRTVRAALWDNQDFVKALKEYPLHLRYERAMLNHLVMTDGDYAHAFDVLSNNLKRLFVHAYQSYIFNKILSRRMEDGLPLNNAVEGDVVCFVTGGLPDVGKLQAVDRSNLEAVNRLAGRGRAYVTLPLFGYESHFAEGLPGEIERRVIEEEKVTLEGFKVPANPKLGSSGFRRPAFLMVEPQWAIEDDDSSLLRFFLPAGSYATVVLREYMKTGS